MSDFNYPIQVDDSVYDYTLQDINYNQVFTEIFNNSDIKDILKKLRIQLKLGIESNLVETAYFYVVLLDYFDALFEYYSKATDTEKSTFYTDYIKCVENIAVCKSNPKLMRALNDLVKVIPPVECGLSYLTDNSVYLKSNYYTYKINNLNKNNFSDQYCFYYTTSTFDVVYQENLVDDLDPLNGNYSYNFKDKSIFIIGQGIHHFELNRRTNRTITFIMDDYKDTLHKQLHVSLLGYALGVVDTGDPSNTDLPSTTVAGSGTQMVKKVLTISWDSNTDITTYTYLTTNIIGDTSPLTLQ